MRKFYLEYPNVQTLSGQLIWSHICEFLIIEDKKKRNFYEKFKAFLKEQYNQKPPSWFDRIIEAFSYSDPKGTAFRYGITIFICRYEAYTNNDELAIRIIS